LSWGNKGPREAKKNQTSGQQNIHSLQQCNDHHRRIQHNNNRIMKYNSSWLRDYSCCRHLQKLGSSFPPSNQKRSIQVNKTLKSIKQRLSLSLHLPPLSPLSPSR
jgi:hypothetical protein